MNYKKSILSLATIMALSNIATADTSATYLPLTTSTNDGSWILFGVNGFSNGVPSNAIAGPTSFSSGMTELDDADATDDLATSGLTVAGGDLASLQGLAESGLTSVKIGVDITGITYQSTEPVRSMYIKVNDTDPNVKFNYKAALEGKNMEIIINGSTTTVYSVVISEESTWNNASTAAIASENTNGGGDDMKTIVTVLDGNSTDNPVNAANWDKDTHLTAITSSNNVNFYRFDALTQEWKIYKNKNSAAANDFTSFDKGSAYWGRVDMGDDPINNDADGATNLILGKSGNSAQSQLPAAYLDDTNTSRLTPGWNMLAFDDIKPYVRHAATGLLLTGVATGDVLSFTDDTGVNIAPDINMTSNGDNTDAQLINTSIEAAKLRGILPSAFNIKAFSTQTAQELVIISDKKFTVANKTVGGTIAVKTLNNQDPYVNASQVNVNDLGVDPLLDTATSAYGEFAIMINPLVGAGTANAMDNNVTDISKLLFGDSLNSDHTAITLTGGANTIDSAATAIAGEATLTPTTLQVDTNFDGTEDMIIVANATPFYVRDTTFTRVFTVDTATIDGPYTIAGSSSAAVTPVVLDGLSQFVTAINGQVGTTDVYAGSTGTSLVVVTTAVSTFDIKDTASGTADYFANVTESDKMAQGAVKGVYSLDTLAKKPLVQHSFPITFIASDQPDEAGDQLTININNIGDVNLTAADANLTDPAATTAQRLAWFDGLTSSINSYITSNALHGYASHTYTEAIDSFTSTILTIEGIGIRSVVLTEADDNSTLTTVPTVGADANAATAETFGTIKGDLVEDLKFNAIYTPNYANYGPLYTMRDAGYDVKAILRGTTKLTDESISWDSIDITRNEDDWFIQNEFNLFSVNLYSGYWVYLADKSPDVIEISNATFDPTYTYYFDNDADKTTTNNVVGGQLRATIAGLEDSALNINGTTSNVYAIIAGEEVQMKLNSGTEYTADITKFESIDFKEIASDISFTIRATNGKGEAIKAEDAVMFDYGKPEVPTITYPNATSAIFTSASADTAKFYVFDAFIPEIANDRSNAIVSTVDATAGSGTSNICQEFDWGVVNTLRVVAVDGDGNFGTANVSNATEFKYASLFKGASVITHLNDGTSDKSQLATVYDDTCTQEATQPTGSENTGVSIKALISNKSARIAYIADKTVSFDTNLAWDAIYELPDGTDVIQVQNVETYANDKFLIEYDNKLYEANFPADQADADDTVNTPKVLTEITPANTSLAPL